MTPLQMKIYQKKYSQSHKIERKAYNKNNAVRIKANMEKYRKNNAVEIKANMKEYNKNNAVEIKLYNKAYNKNNAVKLKANRKAYLKNNAVRIKAIKKPYQKKYNLQFPWRRTFVGIKTRCTNKNSPTYKRYKNRLGDITSDQLKAIWLRDQAYLMVRPSIDRIDNDGVYTKSNLRYIEASDHAVKTGNETRQRKDKNKK